MDQWFGLFQLYESVKIKTAGGIPGVVVAIDTDGARKPPIYFVEKNDEYKTGRNDLVWCGEDELEPLTTGTNANRRRSCRSKEEYSVNEKIDLVSVIRRHNFHAAYFTFRGTQYIFSGWWILDWSKLDEQDDDSKYKIYDTIEEFLDDPFFDGRTLAEVQDELTDIDYDLEPW